jgi:hypothetical protein
VLSFSTARLGAPHAVVAPRLRLLPYRSWDLRPTGGLGGSTVALTLRVSAAGLQLACALRRGLRVGQQGLNCAHLLQQPGN